MGYHWTDKDRQWHTVGPGLSTGGDCRSEGDYLSVSRVFTHVLDCRIEAYPQELKRIRDLGLSLLHVPTDDDGVEKGDEWFGVGVPWALDAIERGGHVLVHCHMGMNRGPSMAYATLLAMGRSRAEAMTAIQRRPVARGGVWYAEDADHWFKTMWLTGRSRGCKVPA